jgi:hypothetical protein
MTKARRTVAEKARDVRPRERLNALLRDPCTSIGDYERLAGVDTQNHGERHALWQQFQHLFRAPTQVLFDAVLGHCASITLQRVAAGELSLIQKDAT